LTGYINSGDELTEVCEGTNIKNDRNRYMRKRIVGVHGQALNSGVPWRF
jgi:unsaturated rhamnogalacturonyl hydrolase